MSDRERKQHFRRGGGKGPAFEHDGLKLYETSAIIRYIDRAFGGVSDAASHTGSHFERH